ncbi:MAG: DUF423 domain-containing protein [Chitinophagaceae bacterium]|nr:DUF423 domain-containing protein [Chitinophagaceae bacterium]
MHKKYIVTGAFLGGLAVALGAFGAHGLQKMTDDVKVIQNFQTAAQYQMYHALAVMATGILMEKFSNRLLSIAAVLFVLGIIFFSGSLYLMTWLKIGGSTVVRALGPVTPLGGICLISGWVLLMAGVLKKK